MTDPKDKLIVALDVPDVAAAKTALTQLSGKVSLVKIGLELYTREGRAIVERAAKEGFCVFLDLKFHDIPNTVAKAVAQVADLDIFMTKVHTLGGLEMMQAAEQSLTQVTHGKARPLLIGVTVLTSHSQQSFSDDLGIPGTIQDSVIRYAQLAQRAGLDGFVASPHEIAILRSTLGKDFKIVTPGVRPAWASSQDQKRVMTPKEAIQAGADYIVVGRPILAAPSPADAVKKILEEINEG